MRALTELEERLAEAHGLAISASAVAARVASLVDEPELVERLEGLRAEADQARARCAQVEHRIGGESTTAELLARANSVAEKGLDLISAWFKAGTGPLPALTFLVMGEAGELAAWSALRVLARNAAPAEVRELADWGLQVQKRHLESALEGLRAYAARVEPSATRWG